MLEDACTCPPPSRLGLHYASAVLRIPARAVQPDPVHCRVVARNALWGLHLDGEERSGKEESEDYHPLFRGFTYLRPP